MNFMPTTSLNVSISNDEQIEKSKSISLGGVKISLSSLLLIDETIVLNKKMLLNKSKARKLITAKIVAEIIGVQQQLMIKKIRPPLNSSRMSIGHPNKPISRMSSSLEILK